MQYPIPTAAFNPATACLPPVTTQTGAGTSFRFYNNCNIPNQPLNGGDIGTSDLEPKLFFDVNTPSTGIAFTAADEAVIDVKPLAGLGFGVPMTIGLRTPSGPAVPERERLSSVQPTWDDLLPTSADTDGDGLPGPGRRAHPRRHQESDHGRLALARCRHRGRQQPTMPISPRRNGGMLTRRITKWSQLHRDGVTLVQAATAAGLRTGGQCRTFIDNQRVHICRRNVVPAPRRSSTPSSSAGPAWVWMASPPNSRQPGASTCTTLPNRWCAPAAARAR